VSTNAPTGTSAPATAPATAPAAAPATIIPSNDAPLVGTTKVYYIRSAAAGPCPRTLQVPLCVAGDLSVVMSNGTGSREWWYFVPVANKPNTYYIRSWDRAFFQPSCWGYLSTVPCASGPFAGVFWEKNVLEEWVATPVPGKAQTFTLQVRWLRLWLLWCICAYAYLAAVPRAQSVQPHVPRLAQLSRHDTRDGRRGRRLRSTALDHPARVDSVVVRYGTLVYVVRYIHPQHCTFRASRRRRRSSSWADMAT
jgi:hypothetical protein